MKTNLLLAIALLLLLVSCADIDDPQAVQDQQLRRSMLGTAGVKQGEQQTFETAPAPARVPGE